MNTLKTLFNLELEPQLIKELQTCQRVTFPKDNWLTTLSENAPYTPIVIKGAVKIMRSEERGKEILMYVIHPGESCIISITSSLKNSFKNMESILAYTMEETEALLVTDAQIRDWHDRFKSWRSFITNLYNARLGELFKLVDSVAFHTVDSRIIDLLKAQKDSFNNVYITHQEIANRVGTAREVASRALKQLEHTGAIKLSRGRIEIISLT